MQTTTAAAASSDAPPVSSSSSNIAGIDLALLVDQLTRTGSSPEMTATVLSTLVATSPDAGPDEQKQILHKLTEALRERQRQIELQKHRATNGSSAAATVTTSSQPTTTVSSPVPSSVVTTASTVKQDEYKPPAVAVSMEPTTKSSELLLPSISTAVPIPASSVTTSCSSPAVSSYCVVPSMPQSAVSLPGSFTVTPSSISASALSTLPSTMPTSAPSATSALPPAIQQMLSGQSFENLKNILANVASRKSGAIGVQEPSSIVSSAGSTTRPLDSYTTSKGSRSDLHRMVPPPDSSVQTKKSPEEDELFVANIHGDVDYRRLPPVPSEPPKSDQSPFSVGDQFPTPENPAAKQPEGPYMGEAGSRSLLPGPFPQSLSYQSSGSGPLLPPPLHTGKPQALLPTPDSVKPPEPPREPRGRENREGRRQRSENVETNVRDHYKDRRDRSSSRDNDQRRQSLRERSDVGRRPERRDRSQSKDQSVTQKAPASSRGTEARRGTKVPPYEEGPIIIDDDCSDIPLPPTTAASKMLDSAAPPAETSTSKTQITDADRKVLLPTPNKEDSSGEKKSDEPRREPKFSRWDHRRPLKSSPGKATSETKGKKALLETPTASGSLETERGKVSTGDGYHRDAKDSRPVRHEADSKSSDSKSVERRRSRSRSATRHVASNLVERSRRRLVMARRHRSSSRDRRHSAHSGSRTSAANDNRRMSRSRERPAQRSTSRDRLEVEEMRLRKQLDDIVARKNEGNRSHDRQFSPSYTQDKPRDQSAEIPSIFDKIPLLFDRRQGSDPRPNTNQPLQRRHLLPAPGLVSAGLKGKALLDLPQVLRPPDVARGMIRHGIDRGMHYGQSANQPPLSSAPVLPGRPFVQEYSHKPADTHTDQPRFREVVDHTGSWKEPEPGRPVFHEEHLGQHRYRPYPMPEDRHRMPMESSERGRAWQGKDRPKEERDPSTKTSDFSTMAATVRTLCGKEQSGLSELSVSDRSSSSAFPNADQTSATNQSDTSTQEVASSSVKPKLPDTGECSEPPSSAAGTVPTGENLVDKPSVQTPDTASTTDAESTIAIMPEGPVPCPDLPMPMPPIPPIFPAIVENVRNVMFPRVPLRVPFNPMIVEGMPVPPPMRSIFGPPPVGVPMLPGRMPMRQRFGPPMMALVNRAPVPLNVQGPPEAAGKKPLLGDFPVPFFTPEVAPNVDPVKDAQSDSVEQQSEALSGEEQVHDQDPSISHFTPAPPRLSEFDPTQNTPCSQLPLFGDESAEQNSEIPSLMDFGVYRSGPLDPRLPRLPLMRGVPPHIRGRMPPPGRGVPLRVARPMSPALRAFIEMRRARGLVNFSRHGDRGDPSIPPPRTGPRYPQNESAPPEFND